MKSFFMLLITFNMTVSAQAQVDPFLEPPVQSDEDVSNFKKGAGAPPKNGASKFFKGIKMNRPTLGGSGCPAGTVSATLTEDNKTLSLLFDNYVAQAGRTAGINRDVKECTILLPVEVPADSQFAVVKLDYRGFNSIPQNGRTRYVTIYSVKNASTGKQIGRRTRRRFDFAGPLEDTYIISSDVSTNPVWSTCGKSMNFKIETRAIAQTNDRADDVMATIDSIDAAAGTNVQYHLLWQSCQTETKFKDGNGKRPFALKDF